MSPRRPDLPPLTEAELLADPIEMFGAWFRDAAEQGPLAEAVCLTTVDPDGLPDARMVLLKGFGADGFRFFSNEGSAKGRQLAARPAAALVFYWREADRQVRVRGPVERLPDADADAYFATRPRTSRLGAWASAQSTPLAGREELEARVAAAEERYPGEEIPRPPYWGGYLVVPAAIEFWQGRVGRLHDRFRFTRELPGGEWEHVRLSP